MRKELKEAEEAGAMTVGVDIDSFYGGKRGDRLFAPKAMGPKTSREIRMLVEGTRLSFIFKGILSSEDARKALDLGAGGSSFPTMRNHNRLCRSSAGSIAGNQGGRRRPDAHLRGQRIPAGIRVMKALALGRMPF